MIFLGWAEVCVHLSLTSEWLCFLGYLAGQPPLPGPLFLVSKPKLICLVLQEVTFNAVGIISH